MNDIEYSIGFIGLIYLHTDCSSLLVLQHTNTCHISRKFLPIYYEAANFAPILTFHLKLKKNPFPPLLDTHIWA